LGSEYLNPAVDAHEIYEYRENIMDKERTLEEKINRLLEMFPAVAVIGPRQCGKSTIVRRLRADWKYYDLESPDDYQLISGDPTAFFAINPGKVIIDEAQKYPDLFKTLRGVIDAERKQKKNRVSKIGSGFHNLSKRPVVVSLHFGEKRSNTRFW